MLEITAAVSGAVGVVSTTRLTCGAGLEFGMVIVAGGAGSRPAVSVGVPGFGAGAEVCAGGMTGVDVAATGAAATAGAASEIVGGAAEVGAGAGAGVDDGAGVTARGGAVTTGATTTAGVAGEIEAGADGVGFAAGCTASGGVAAAGLGALDGVEAGVTAFSVRTIAAPLTGAEDAGGTGAGTRAGTGSVVGSAPTAAEYGPRTTLSICAAGTTNMAPGLLAPDPYAVRPVVGQERPANRSRPRGGTPRPGRSPPGRRVVRNRARNCCARACAVPAHEQEERRTQPARVARVRRARPSWRRSIRVASGPDAVRSACSSSPCAGPFAPWRGS